MPTTDYVIRDDGLYTVVVGWNDELETFFGSVVRKFAPDGGVVYEIGTRPGEVRTLSTLCSAMMGYSSLDAQTVSALRRASAL